MVDALLLLLPLATTVALSAVLAITVIGYQISYAIVSTKKHINTTLLSKLSCRVIRPSPPQPIILRATTGRKAFRQGAFSLGRFSMPIHVIGGSWLFLTSFIFFWPTKWPVVVSGVNGGDSSTDNSKCAQTHKALTIH